MRKDDREDAPIIVGVDGSAASIDALERAATLAKALGAPLEAITAWTYPVMLDRFDAFDDWSPQANAQRLLEDTVLVAFHGDKPNGFRMTTLPGPPAEVLIEQSDRASMVVVGSRGLGGFSRLLLGSTSAACAAHARCPVLIVHSAP